MKNRDYWINRFKQLENSANNKGAEFYADIEKHYINAQKEIEKQILSWYQRFADNNQISMAEARKWLSAKELAELKWDIKEYIKKGEENAINQKWIK